MSPGITMAGAITALVTEKRAVGYKYDAEERVLARFAAFSGSQFPGVARRACPGLGRGVDHLGPRAGSQAGDPAGPGRAGAEAARGWAAGACRSAPALPAGALPRPARYVPHIYTDQELTPWSPKLTAATTTRRSRSGTGSCRCCSARSMAAACAPPRPGCCASATLTSVPAPGNPRRQGRQGPAGAGQRAAARKAG